MAAGLPSSSFVSDDHSQHGNHFPFSHLNLKHTLSHLFLKRTKACHFKHDNHHETTTSHDHIDDHDRPDYHLINSASNFPSVPVIYMNILAESVKEQLPSMSYGNFLERSSREDREAKDDDQCIVCLNKIEQSHEVVKVPFNCGHVFHSECLDAWVDQGQGTCPLCRSKLLPKLIDHHDDDHELLGSRSHDHQEVDPWRLERMVYLFGDDCLFD